jgi:hypothetical protein
MDSTDAVVTVPADFDAFLVDYIPCADGLWSLVGIDDDRPIDAWSSAHAARCVQMLPIARSRVSVAEWALADVQARGIVPCIARAAANLARARADLADWQAQARRLEAARQVTYGAWSRPIVID